MKRSKKARVSNSTPNPIGDVVALPALKTRARRTRTRAHKRVNDTLLGPLERPALQWLAERMPAWVTPDLLTALGFAASILIFASYWLTRVHPAFLWLATLGFLINWFGDSLDGTLARYRKVERPKYGYYLDHSIDALSEVLIFLGAGLSAYLHFEFAALALIGYLLISLHVFLSTYVMGEFRLSYLSLGPTETRIIAMVTNAVLFFAGPSVFRLLGMDMTIYDIVAILLAAMFFGIFIVASLTSSAALAKVEDEKKEEQQ